MSLRNIFKNSYFYLFLFSILFTLVSFVSVNVASIVYDYPFHMGRIIGLAQSVANKDILPNLNYLFLRGSGYGLPMFYGNWMFYFPALVFLKTKVATFAFAAFVWQSVLFTSYTTHFAVEKMTGDKLRSFLAAIAVSCSVVYFGFGMTAVIPLIPLLLYSIHKVLYKNELNPVLLAVTIALLIQTHIISTIVLAIFSALIVLLNVTKLTYQKILSFLSSVLISVCLMVGFILQYLEQSASQEFFVNWKLRDFPFPSNALMSPSSLLQMIKSYYWPLLFVFLFLSILFFRKLDAFSKRLILATILMFAFSTRLLPWNILRETFISVFQYTERLTYLLPVFVIIALAKSGSKKLVIVVSSLQILVYLYSFPMRFTFNSIPYSERGFQDNVRKIMDVTNRDALSAYTDPFGGYTYDTSGDEYLTIDVNHENIRNGTITQFEYDSNNLEISNIKNGYNSLDFDITLQNGADEQSIVLPRIWYKGYNASYSDGGSGTQPELAYANKTSEELSRDQVLKKPENKKKVLYDGRAVIYVSESGHVHVSYKKTVQQWIGYVIEFCSFVAIFIYAFIMNFRKLKRS